MMEKVTLKKRENYLSLMTGVKVFIADNLTQKRGYKLLARIIEKYELQSVEELYEIREEITPLMRGQATKQRLQLIKSYIDSLIRFTAQSTDKAAMLPKISELLRSMVIELMTSINNSNIKIRTLSGEIFGRISVLLASLDALSQLL